MQYPYDFINKIILGDNLDILKYIPDNSIDAVITDPPACIEFLGKDWDNFKKNKRSSGWSMQGKNGGDDFGGFGKKLRPAICSQKNKLFIFQDYICEIFLEVKRVLKYGGYMLVWALPKTSHHTAMGIERAGFEIKDCIYHVFGSGMPKSLNIGKQVDKLYNNDREIIKKTTIPNTYKKEYHIKQGYRKDSNNNKYKGEREGAFITKGNSEWEGYGTGLKPAIECWWLCRKPNEKGLNIVQNVLKWGTGALNIDRCKILTDDNLERPLMDTSSWHGNKWGENKQNIIKDKPPIPKDLGRFPSNFLHDGSDEVLEFFPNTKSGGGIKANKNSIGLFNLKSNVQKNFEFNSGSASRFFYCSKASQKERNIGLEEFDKKNPYDRNSINNNFEGMGSKSGNRANFHPTVKPIKLMQYLINLIAPKNSIVLDCFAGSGSTLLACIKENVNFIGIEKEQDYVNIANKRINYLLNSKYIIYLDNLIQENTENLKIEIKEENIINLDDILYENDKINIKIKENCK